MKNRITIKEEKPFKVLKCKEVGNIIPESNIHLTKEMIDNLIDMMLQQMPGATTLMIHPDDYKSANIGKYQYRKLRIKVTKWCPPLTIYIGRK